MRIYLHLLAAFFLFFAGSIYANTQQEKRVTGTVTSEGEPLPGVSVQLKGASSGTITDIDGNYSIEAPVNGTLVFRFVGMKTVEQPVNNRNVINVTLDSESKELEEVMVVAYATAKKYSFTGAASTMKAGEIEKLQTSSVSRVLEGTVSGVQASAASGQPGTDAEIRIRGIGSINASSAPLYVVDGVPFDGSVNSINPDDISSMTVLKDAASAALYGSRGANGVIIVKTKTGKNNEKISVTAGYSVTVGNPVKRYKPLNTEQFKEVQDLLLKNTMSAIGRGQVDKGDAAYFLTPVMMLVGNFSISGYEDMIPLYNYDGLNEDVFGDVSTNWEKEIENHNAINQQFDLGVRGGGKAINYSFVFNSTNQDGLFINDGLKRYGVRLAVDANITERLKSGATMGYTFSKLRDATSFSDMDTKPWLVRPDRAVRDESGNFVRLPGSNYGQEFLGANPVAKRGVKNRTDVNQFIGSAYAQYRILDNLKVRGDINIASFRTEGSSFMPLTAMDDMIYYDSFSSLYESSSNTTNTSVNFRADYNLDMKDHHLTLMVGYGWDRTFTKGSSVSYSDFVDDIK